MAAVFTMSTIWLRTGLMPRWLVGLSYLTALALLVESDVSMWGDDRVPGVGAGGQRPAFGPIGAF
jgi:hypothetical protein